MCFICVELFLLLLLMLFTELLRTLAASIWRCTPPSIWNAFVWNSHSHTAERTFVLNSNIISYRQFVYNFVKNYICLSILRFPLYQQTNGTEKCAIIFQRRHFHSIWREMLWYARIIFAVERSLWCTRYEVEFSETFSDSRSQWPSFGNKMLADVHFLIAKVPLDSFDFRIPIWLAHYDNCNKTNFK